MFRISSALGVSAVVLGAFGAHALKERLAISGLTEVWEKAVLYHLVHAVAYLALTAWASVSDSARARMLARIGTFWWVGILCFSGSLYALALGAPRWVGPITPLGGLAFIIGWVLIAFVGKSSNAHPSV